MYVIYIDVHILYYIIIILFYITFDNFGSGQYNKFREKKSCKKRKYSSRRVPEFVSLRNRIKRDSHITYIRVIHLI